MTVQHQQDVTQNTSDIDAPQATRRHFLAVAMATAAGASEQQHGNA